MSLPFLDKLQLQPAQSQLIYNDLLHLTIFPNVMFLQIKKIYHMHVSRAVFSITLQFKLSVKYNLLLNT